jgi:hypothetical protein
MKKPINEIAKLKRLAGLITESEYQETMMKDEEKVKEAKTSVSKDKKIQVIKEWIWYTCDEGQVKDDINKYNKMVDMYFTDKDDVTKEDFMKIWNKVTEKYGVGDTGADSEAFPETWRDVQRGRLVDPSMKYEVKEKVKENRTAEELFKMFQDEDLVNDRRDYDEEDLMSAYSDLSSEEAKKLVDMLQNMSEVKEISDAAKDITGDLEGEAFERMNSLVNRNHILSLLAAAEGIMGDLEADGFEVEDIRAYINQIIVNDI